MAIEEDTGSPAKVYSDWWKSKQNDMSHYMSFFLSMGIDRRHDLSGIWYGYLFVDCRGPWNFVRDKPKGWVVAYADVRMTGAKDHLLLVCFDNNGQFHHQQIEKWR